MLYSSLANSCVPNTVIFTAVRSTAIRISRDIYIPLTTALKSLLTTFRRRLFQMDGRADPEVWGGGGTTSKRVINPNSIGRGGGKTPFSKF